MVLDVTVILRRQFDGNSCCNLPCSQVYTVLVSRPVFPYLWKNSFTLPHPAKGDVCRS